MGLFDAFKPKHEHSDWKVRREAVKQIDDQNLLIKIATTDENSTVRTEAVKKITDQQVLVGIAKNKETKGIRPDYYVSARRAAVNKITDQKALKYFADDYDRKVRYNAIMRITDTETLKRLATRPLGQNCEIAAVKNPNLNNEEDLNYIISNSHDARIVNEAENKLKKCGGKLSKTNEIKTRYSYAIHGTAAGRYKSIQNIRDQEALMYILEHEPTPYVRRAAVKNIGDQNVLKRIVDTDDDSDARLVALEKIKDNAFLIRTAESNPDWEVRKAAVKRITDVSVLKDISENDPYYKLWNDEFASGGRYKVREAAEDRLKELSKSSTNTVKVKNTSSDDLDYYCENCFTDIPKSEYCPHCGSINIREK